ncbi:MAG: PTS mannose/fructose/sorbose/N-acetylgalactosamine transporter subunit IIC [[Clostridium] innocuum]
MSNLIVALLAALAYFLCYGGNWLLGQCMIERPLVVGTVTGLLLGDMKTGIMIGGVLEAIYMGAVNIGGATSAEPVSATVMSVTFAITSGLSTEEAIILAVPVGLIFNSLIVLWGMSTNMFLPLWLKANKEGDTKGLFHATMLSWFYVYFTKALVIFFCVYLGADVVQNVVAAIPPSVVKGLQVAAGMLPAVGLALLLKMLVDKQNAAWLFFGYIISVYLSFDAVSIAILAIVIALAIGFNDKQMLDLKHQIEKGGNSLSDEEEFFQ